MSAHKPEGEKELPAPTSKIVDTGLAPDVFADFAHWFSLGGGVVRITLTSIRTNVATQERNDVVIGRLVMPLSGAQDLAVSLYDFLKKRGEDPAGAKKDEVLQ